MVFSAKRAGFRDVQHGILGGLPKSGSLYPLEGTT